MLNIKRLRDRQRERGEIKGHMERKRDREKSPRVKAGFLITLAEPRGTSAALLKYSPIDILLLPLHQSLATKGAQRRAFSICSANQHTKHPNNTTNTIHKNPTKVPKAVK